MAALSSLTLDIIDILSNKRKGRSMFLIYERNADFLEKEEQFIYDDDSGIASLDLTKITQEDISLINSLDYIKMIGK